MNNDNTASDHGSGRHSIDTKDQPEHHEYEGHKHHAHNVTVEEIQKAEDIITAEQEFTPQEYKRLRIKADLILMPMLMILYGLQFSDKTSLASGVVFGLREDTGLVGNQYGDLTTFFYVSYAIAQYPMAWALQRFPLGRALAVCVIVWGAAVMILGACNNYGQLSGVRVLLGWFEAVVTPGFAIFTASWYLRSEQTLRQMLYYSMNSLFGIIFGLGTYYVALNAQTKGGLAAWRVINLFLGGTTVGMGIIFLVFGGTPDEVWWLSKREKRMAKARIVSNGTGGGETHKWNWYQVRECFRDPQYWFAVTFNLCGNVPNGGLTTFQNLIFRSFGFTSLQTVLYSLPLFAVTFTLMILSGLIVNYFPRTRFPLAIAMQLITLMGLLFAGLAKANKWTKWGMFVFSYFYQVSTFVAAWPVISVNVAGRTKKSFFGASSLFIYCIGNIVGSQVFRPSDAPRYIKGLIVCAVFIGINSVNFTGWWIHYLRENRRRNKAQAETGMSEEQREYANRLAGETDMTDMENVHFRYLC